MAEKKVKIDLKTRLGRASSMKAPSSSSTPVPGMAPPPPPTGLAPPPGIVQPGGIPAPPFASQQQQAQQARQARAKSDDPFHAVSAEDAAPKPQEIKIEIGHEVVAAGKKSRAYIAIAAVLASVVGVGIGYALGGMSARAAENQAAVRGAGEIAVDIEKAKGNIDNLANKVDAATKTMFKEKKFPADFSKDLEGITIDFSSSNLAGKNINKLKGSTVRSLFDFARDAQELEAKRDWLRRLFDGRKVAIEEILTGAQNPKINYVLFVGKAQKGAVGTFAAIKDPFEFNKDWPEKVTILGTGQEVAAERYKTGEPFVKAPRTQGEAPTVYAIPIEPDGITTSFPNPLGARIQEELRDISTLIRGTPVGTAATQEKTGLLKLADDLVQELKAVGAGR